MMNFYMLCSSILIFSISLVMSAPANLNEDVDLAKALAEEIKEYHFHVYFFQNNAESNKSAELLFAQIQELVKLGFFHPVPYKINYQPRGPHVIGSYEVWCPKEHFSRVYSWFLLHRGQLTVLIHPLTREEIKDHTDRAAFMGPSAPLDLAPLSPLLDKVPLQYPELGLGYSAPVEKQ